MLEADRQREYRARRTKRFGAMRAALTSILSELDGNDKPLAVKLRSLAQGGLDA